MLSREDCGVDAKVDALDELKLFCAPLCIDFGFDTLETLELVDLIGASTDEFYSICICVPLTG